MTQRVDHTGVEPSGSQSFYAHPTAIVESPHVGPRTRIWAFAHVLPGAVIGADCNVCDHVFVENDVRLGDRVTVKCGVQIWDGVQLEDDVFVGPNATFTNDPRPRSRQWQGSPARTIVRAGATIGANATILPGITIGTGAIVGPGAVVTQNVPAHASVVGNPAHIAGYAESRASRAPTVVVDAAHQWPERVRGVRMHEVKVVTDIRGSLSAAELGAGLPFQPARLFTVFDVPSRQVRGEHAHKTLHQWLVCLRGSITLMVDDGEHREAIVLDTPARAVHVPPMIWAAQYQFSPDAILLVAASAEYDADEYIRDYDEFLHAVSQPSIDSA